MYGHVANSPHTPIVGLAFVYSPPGRGLAPHRPRPISNTLPCVIQIYIMPFGIISNKRAHMLSRGRLVRWCPGGQEFNPHGPQQNFALANIGKIWGAMWHPLIRPRVTL
jgi:hypothetical protein